jgi:DegV family protein with EDD domain
MKKIGLVVDEGADLPKELVDKHQMAIVPVKMDWPDLENLPGENTFQRMREAEKRGIKSFGKTSQPSPKDFLDSFKKQLEKFDKIICITLTSKLSGTYNSAVQARGILNQEDQKRAFIVDSLNASCGEALFALKAVDLIEKGKEAEEIVRELEKFSPQVHLYGMLEEIKWLEASGRISPTMAKWVRRMQKIGVRPIIGVKKGVLKAIGIKAGAKDISTALFHQFESKTKKLRDQGKKIRVTITHGDNLKGAQKLKETIEKDYNLPTPHQGKVEVAFINLIDNVLGVLVGPDALVLAWSEA